MNLQHLAVIMDGNRRWAKINGLSSHEGHQRGAENLWAIVNKANSLDIKYLTVFGFSTENWKRSSLEVNFLLELLVKFLNDTILKINEYNFKIKFIGDLNIFDKIILEKMEIINNVTINNQGLVLSIALNYGGRNDILCALNQFIKLNKSNLDSIILNETNFKDFTLNKGIPDPDLLIRTGGELRLSNFLLWDLAYTELFFSSEMWPDFNEECLEKAVLEFSSRIRKFGGDN
jgi:undecaprenyl diphosphate synthase